MAKKDLFSSLFFLLLSIFVCWESIYLRFGSFSKPGPGFLSLLAGLLLGSLAIVLALRTWMTKNIRQKFSDIKTPWKPLLITFGSMIGFTFLIEVLGFNSMTFLFIGGLLFAVERKTWKLSIVVAVCVAAGAYLIFDLLLRSQLPRGPFGL